MERYLFRMELVERSSVLRLGMKAVGKGEELGNNKEVRERS